MMPVDFVVKTQDSLFKSIVAKAVEKGLPVYTESKLHNVSWKEPYLELQVQMGNNNDNINEPYVKRVIP